MSSSEMTGSADAIVVASDRSSTWLVETLTRSPAREAGGGQRAARSRWTLSNTTTLS